MFYSEREKCSYSTGRSRNLSYFAISCVFDLEVVDLLFLHFFASLSFQKNLEKIYSSITHDSLTFPIFQNFFVVTFFHCLTVFLSHFLHVKEIYFIEKLKKCFSSLMMKCKRYTHRYSIYRNILRDITTTNFIFGRAIFQTMPNVFSIRGH